MQVSIFIYFDKIMQCFETLSTFISGKFRCKRIIFKIIQRNMEEITFSCQLCYLMLKKYIWNISFFLKLQIVNAEEIYTMYYQVCFYFISLILIIICIDLIFNFFILQIITIKFSTKVRSPLFHIRLHTSVYLSISTCSSRHTVYNLP